MVGSLYYFQNPKWNILWMLLPVLGALLMWLTRDKHTEGKVSTFVDRVINNVWLVMGLTAWFVSMLAFQPDTAADPVHHPADDGHGNHDHGLIIRFRPATAGGTAAIVLAPVSLIVSGYWMPTLFAVGFVDDDYPGTYPQLQVEPYERITQWTSRKYPKRKRWTSSLASSTAICAA